MKVSQNLGMILENSVSKPKINQIFLQKSQILALFEELLFTT